MVNNPIFKTADEHQRVYDLIWSQMPHMQKPTSSSWWFFILFPKEEEGYGPRQMMFSIATRAGEQIRIHDVWLPGLDLNRQIENGVDKFPAIAVGWYCDGRQVHEDIIKETAVTTLSYPDKFINCRTSAGYGYEIRSAGKRPLSLEAHITGKNGAAHFEAWGDLDCLDSSPHESLNIDTPVGGVHFIAWRRMNFQGEFDLPTGKESLSGICYFQRVCLNVPVFPWKWIWALFPDGSMFSAYVPYIGLNLFRRYYKLFDSNRKEQAAIPISGAAFWDWAGSSPRIHFNKASVTPVIGNGPHPQFEVRAGNNKGDHISFLAAPYGHTNLYIDRPVLRNWLRTHWSYNEYMFRMEGLTGSVQNRPIDTARMGQGFGSLEYTWGLGL